MKSVKEIKDYRNNNRLAPLVEGQQDLNLFLIDCIIGITEHLEAIKTPGSDKLTLASFRSAERRGMIAALRWVCGQCASDEDSGKCDANHARNCPMHKAIARLENGGDL